MKKEKSWGELNIFLLVIIIALVLVCIVLASQLSVEQTHSDILYEGYEKCIVSFQDLILKHQNLLIEHGICCYNYTEPEIEFLIKFG